MKKDSSPQRRRLMISKNSILMLVALVAIFLAIWAWFTAQNSATASGISLKTESPETLEIAVANADGTIPDDDEFTSSLDLDNYISVIKTLDKDITSDGFSFIIPETNQSSGTRYVVDPGVSGGNDWVEAVANEDYISIPIYVRTKSDMALYVSEKSSVEATLFDSSGNIVDESSFCTGVSVNAIAGAVRVSVVDMTSEIDVDNNTVLSYTPSSSDEKLLWITRPDLYFDGSSLTTEVADNTYGTYQHQYYSVNSGVEKTITTIQTVEDGSSVVKASVYKSADETPTLSTNCQLSEDGDSNNKIYTFTDSEGTETEYFMHKFVVNIWIEGTDSEARRALNEGTFKLNLKFCSDDA